MEEALYIVDALNFLFRAYHALPPLTTTRGLPTGAVYGLCQMLLRLERENRPTHLCVVFDAPGRTFRDDLYPAYKAHRPPMPPDLAAQVELVHRVVETFRIPSISIPGVEADDVIASLATRVAAEGKQVVVCSSDKDLMQLCCDRIALLDTMRNRRLSSAEVQEKFGVTPDKVGDVLALMGDSIDNIPGVAGIGPKTAAELINRFGSLGALLDHAHEVKGKKGETLAAARAAAELSRRLVALKTDVGELPPTETLRRQEPDPTVLTDLFRELEFFRLVTQIESQATAPAQGTLFSESASPAAAAAPPGPAAPTVTTEIVRDLDRLGAWAERIRQEKQVSLSLLHEGPSTLRGHLVGLGGFVSGQAFYLPLDHRRLDEPAPIDRALALAILRPLLADPAIVKHVHDAKSATLVFAVGGIGFEGVGVDVLLGAYLLDASTTRYDLDSLASGAGQPLPGPRSTWLREGKTTREPSGAPGDLAGRYVGQEAATVAALASQQRELLKHGGLWNLYRDLELPLAGVLARIEAHGIRLDREHLGHLGQELSSSIVALEQEIHRLAGTTFNIGSPKQLGEVLFGKLQLPVIRRTKTGPSTDADVLEELAALHEVPAKIVEYRALSKLKGTYVDALPLLVVPETGRLHTTFNQAVAATGRLSSSDPNLQNIPIRTEIGRRIRQAFVADPGYQLVSADYSQIELRILAHFSQDPAFLDAFRSGADIHQRTASEVFGVAPDAVSAEQRRIAKAINFGLVFGQSDFGLAQAVRIPRATAKAYIQSYFARYAGVRAYMERTIAEARATGVVTTLLGRRRPLPDINARRPPLRSHAERVARNTPIQGSAADILKLAMIRIDRDLPTRFPGARLLLTVHDELVFEVPEGDVQPFQIWVKGEMEAAFSLRVPLLVEVGAGPNWGAAH